MKLATRRTPNFKNLIHHRIMVIIIALMLLPLAAFSQANKKQPAQPEKEKPKEAIQFINQPIVDILLAMAEIFDKSVVPDDTVKGYGSYHVTNVDFETNLKLFLTPYKMYYHKEGDVYYVSRIQVDWNKEKKLLNLHAEDVPIPMLVKSLMGKMEGTIIYDPLPEENTTLYLQDVPVEKFLNILLTRYPDYKIKVDSDYFFVKKEVKQPDNNNNDVDQNGIRVNKKAVSGLRKNGDRYSINQPKIRFKEFLDDLFNLEGREYSLFMNRDNVIENFSYSNKTFPEMLRLLMEQSNADYSILNDVYYIFEVQQRDILKKLFTTIFLPVKYLSVRDLPNLLPSDLSSGRFYKLDINRNAIILYGSIEEITPVVQFIRQVDTPTSTYQQYYRYDMAYADARNIRAVLPAEFRTLDPVLIPNTNSFTLQLTPEQKKMFDDYIVLIDRNDMATPVRLRYIQADDLLKKLPPSIPREKIVETPNPTMIFVKGTDASLKAFYKELEVLDRPVPQLRYQLLVIQYKDTKGFAINPKDANGKIPQALKMDESANVSFTGSLSSLLGINFDIPSVLGVGFAVNLNASLNNSKAQVMADTTLVGLSGQDVNFSNTETERKKDTVTNNQDHTTTEIIREFQSGLNFGVNGLTSGGGMITMKLTADLTQNTDQGGLPRSATNKITTLARTMSGEVVQIGGLIRQDLQDDISKVPLLGDIPLLGLLFQSKNQNLTNSEVVIYVLPRVESQYSEEIELGIQLERLYNKFLDEEK